MLFVKPGGCGICLLCAHFMHSCMACLRGTGKMLCANSRQKGRPKRRTLLRLQYGHALIKDIRE